MGKKPLFWIASSKKDFDRFPKKVLDEGIFALDLAREGTKYGTTKPLSGFHGASVLEIILRAKEGTFRVIYTVKMKHVIYVLHAFQKKSKTGIKTPMQEINLIHNRLDQAISHYHEWEIENEIRR